MLKREKLLKWSLIISTSLLVLSLSIYMYFLPALISSSLFHNLISEVLQKTYGIEYYADSVNLKTGFNPNITLNIKELSLKKTKKEILNIQGIDTEISLSDIFQNRIIIKKALAENIFVNINELSSAFETKEQNKSKPCNYSLDFFNALLGIKKCLLTYNDSETEITFDAKDLIIDRTKKRKFVHFDFNFDMCKANKKITVSANDKNKVYMENGAIYIINFPLEIDKSKININAYADKNKKYELVFSSSKFNAADIYEIITSNIIIPDGKTLLKPITNVDGSISFDIKITNKNVDGKINVNESNFEIADLLNMPVKITDGVIDISSSTISLKEFKGYYNNKEDNHFNFDGSIKDYLKSCDTKIVSKVFITNDFFKNYVSKMLSAPIELVGDAGSQLTITSKNGSLDLIWYFLLRENEGFKLGEQSMVLKEYKTLFKADLSVDKNILKLNSIDYFITNELKKGIKPILSIKGNLNMDEDMKAENIALAITRPLPSEFLNFLASQKIFKGGTVSGAIDIDNSGIVPVMQGELSMDNVRIPQQRLFIKTGKIIANNKNIDIISNGRFKRSQYDFNGSILNELKLPIVVKNVNLSVDNIDVERFLNAPNSGTTSNNTSKQSQTEDLDLDDIYTFEKDLIIVEKCAFNLKSGKYKDINFGNIHADLTLDKDGILSLQSNKFDIAEGISTLKVKADLLKQDYYLRLGLKDVNSDTIASALLGLPREISGKAKGLIEINCDKTLKLNGDIKFNIENGSIEKVGYVEYILKVASLFRNPIVMISPTTFGDLVNIPEGKFDSIHGELKLKNNVAQRINIKSSSPMLSSYIAGKYELETGDASLRIYTKLSNKGKGFAGALRNISLNSLAAHISASGRNDSHYYASELSELPPIQAEEKDCQIFLTKIEGDVANFNFLSSLKRIK